MELKHSSVEVKSLQAKVSYVFAADNQRTQRPFVAEVAVALVKAFGGTAFAVETRNQLLWSMMQGAVEFSATRRVAVLALSGTAHELMAAVEGTTGDARDVLDEVWTKLGEIDGAERAALTDFPGTFVNQTFAVVRLPTACTDLIPPLDAMTSFAKDRIGDRLLGAPGALHFRLSVPLSIAVRGVTTESALVIESRFTSLVQDRVYFTVSPLDTDDHLEMLQRIVDAGRPSGG